MKGAEELGSWAAEAKADQKLRAAESSEMRRERRGSKGRISEKKGKESKIE